MLDWDDLRFFLAVARHGSLSAAAKELHVAQSTVGRRLASLEAARRGGGIVPDALLAHLAPLGWQHINLTGDFLWGADAGVGPDGFRPLRNRTAPGPILATAA